MFRQGLKSQSRIKMNIVRCPPVTMVLIRRPDLRYQLGFSVQNGIVSMMSSHKHIHRWRLTCAAKDELYVKILCQECSNMTVVMESQSKLCVCLRVRRSAV